MKKAYGLAVLVFLFAPALLAQEHYNEGPVWEVELVHVKPGHLSEYLGSLQKNSKAMIEEEKKEGVILDYKLFLKQTKSSPQDWDVCIAIEFKNHAAFDGLSAKEEAIRDKIIGGEQQAQQIGQQREEYREVISDELLDEIYLK